MMKRQNERGGEKSKWLTVVSSASPKNSLEPDSDGDSQSIDCFIIHKKSLEFESRGPTRSSSFVIKNEGRSWWLVVNNSPLLLNRMNDR